MTANNAATALPDVPGGLITDQLAEAGYRLFELVQGAAELDRDEVAEQAATVAALAGVVQARTATQVQDIHGLVGQLAELVAVLGPVAEQLAGGGPGALLALLGRR